MAFPLENDVNYETLPKVVHYCKIIEGKGLETEVQVSGNILNVQKKKPIIRLVRRRHNTKLHVYI